jgi:L-methionine (R)-S-oxide reductase
MYNILLNQTKSLLLEESNFITNAGNFASLIFYSLENVNWAGFYIFDGEDLILGPFSGKVACTRIKPSKGVCGVAFSSEQTVVVKDVEKFSGHIACSAESRSEIVIPIFYEKKIVGVFDIDSPILDRFDAKDKNNLEKILREFESQTNLENLELKFK